MASLRKKYAADAAEPMAAEPAEPDGAEPPPSPEAPLPPPQASEPRADALMAQVEALRQADQAQQQHSAQLQAFAAAMARRNEWFTGSPLAQKFVAHLNALHGEAIQAGLVDTSPEYFAHMDGRLAALQAQHDEAAGQGVVEEMHKLAAVNGAAPKQEPLRRPPPSSPPPMVSAPVSRSAPTAAGSRYSRVTLTADQREAARISGVTEAEYARQLPELDRAKAEGRYTQGN